MRRLVNGLLIGLATAVLGVFLGLTPLGATLEKDLALPWLFKVRGEIEPPADVVVVAINESTAEEMELPSLPRDWPRATHAGLIEKLIARGASVIAFDLYFGRERSPDDDRAFAEAVGEAGRVILYEKLDGRMVPVKDADGTRTGFIWREQPLPPMAVLAKAAKGLAPFPLPKEKIAVHEFWSFKESASELPTMPAMALQLHALEHYDTMLSLLEQVAAPGLEELPSRLEVLTGAEEPGGAEKLQTLMRGLRRTFQSDIGLKARFLDALEQEPESVVGAEERRLLSALASLYGGLGNRLLNFYGYPGRIKTVDYHLILDDDGADGLSLKDKVVFIGYSDLYFPGQPDRFFTVFTREKEGVDLSGVEIMATAFANLLTDRSLRPSDTVATIAILFTFGLALGTAIYLLPAFISVPLAFVLTAAYGLLVQVAFNSADLWIPAAVPTYIQFPFALLVGLVGQYLLERRQRRQVSEAISYYLPENIVKDLTERGLDPAMLNQVVHGVCLATDMSGFTTISEQMAPKELAAFMNDYFDNLAQPLKSNDVDVTEFHADTIMCAWTSMEADAGLRRHAISAALDVVEAIGRFAEQHGNMQLNARIGLDEGRFYLGHTGGGGHFAYSILGDCANTASRMEGLNKHVGTHILATQAVVQDLDGLLLRQLGWFRFVGKSDPSPVVEVLARDADADQAQRDLCTRFNAALNVFRGQRWDRAAVLFRALLRDFPHDGPSRFYLERCRDYRSKGPPPENPTVIHMEVK